MPDVPYGLVVITKGEHAGRIGDYDDDDDIPFRGVIYFGGMLRARSYYLIDKRYFREPTINDLFQRYTEIANEIFDILKSEEPPSLTEYKHLSSIMAEQHQVYTELELRNLIGQYGRIRKGKTIYLAHSSKDKGSACGEHRSGRYFVDWALGGAVPAARLSAIICFRHSMPWSVKAGTPSSPTP
jgi:hypothetical protein